MRLFAFIFIISSVFIHAQNSYPQQYFTSPLEIPLTTAGTFGELRSNHFHSGIDLKTQQREGLKVLSSADGFVSRIKISPFGYGKAIYITHPNGYTTVYAHLQKFNTELEAYVKKAQYAKESFSVELFPVANELPIKQGSFIAYSGNSGSSEAPHLHFEIRNKKEHPLNPLLFGLSIADTIPPMLNAFYVYPLNDTTTINNSYQAQKINLKPYKNGEFIAENITAYGSIGFGVETFDQQNFSANKNGVYKLNALYNGSSNFEVLFNEFSFSETKNINEYIDYAFFKTKKKRIQRMFHKNNTLSLYNADLSNGLVNIQPNTNSVYKLNISDYNKNQTTVTINVTGKKEFPTDKKTTSITPYLIHANQSVSVTSKNVSVQFKPNTFSENFYLDFNVRNDTIYVHEDIIPTKRSFNIDIDVSQYNNVDKLKLYIAQLSGPKNKYANYINTQLKNNTLVGVANNLGTYCVMHDIKAPSIVAKNFKNEQWISKQPTLKVEIKDEGSGISSYTATLNDKWILMEYDYKTNLLTYNFSDLKFSETKHNFKLIVTDNVGNSSTFETIFYRK